MSVLGKRSAASSGLKSNQKLKKRKSDNAVFVKWTILSGENQFELSIYQGTPHEDIVKNIAEITKFEVGKFVCKRKDGSLIGLTSLLPNGTAIYVEEILSQGDNGGGDRNGEDESSPEHPKDERLSANKIVENSILLRIMLHDQEPLEMRVKSHTSWFSVFQRFCDSVDKEMKTMKFVHDGLRLNSWDTVGRSIDYFDYTADSHAGAVPIYVMYEAIGS